jgi:hypothetical protein
MACGIVASFFAMVWTQFVSLRATGEQAVSRGQLPLDPAPGSMVLV